VDEDSTARKTAAGSTIRAKGLKAGLVTMSELLVREFMIR
jgi:hypothetical protein